MTSIERTAYPRFKQYPDPSELAELYTPTAAELKLIKARTKSHEGRLRLMVMLKTFQRLGYFSHPECIPVPVIKHLRSCLKLQDWVKAIPSERQRYNYQNIIREYLGVKPYDKKAQKDLAIFVAAEAQIKDHPADLINVAIEKLVKDKYELPAFSTLDRLVSHIRHLTNNRLFQQVSQNLTSAEQNYLDQLLSSETEESTTNLNLLKSLPCSATLSGMKQLIVKFDAMMTFGDAQRLLAQLAPTKVRYFAAHARTLDISEFQDINLNKRRTLLLCLLYVAQVKTRDNLVSMYLKRVLKIHNNAKKRLSELREKHLTQTSELLGTLAQVLTASKETNNHAALGEQVSSIFEQKGGTELLLQKYEEIAAYNTNNHLPLIWRFYVPHRKALFNLVRSLDILSTSADESVIDALNFVLENQHKRSKYLWWDGDLSFISHNWRSLVVKEVDTLCADGKQFTINSKGEPVLKRLKSPPPSTEVEKLQAQIRQLIPERSVLDILCNVEHWLNWTRHFGPISGNEPRLKQPTERYIFTTFGYGCNLGPNEIARHSRDVVTSHMISYTNRRHITTPKIEAAIRDIINSYNRFSLPSIWGTGKKVAADGSKFEIYENNLHSEYHIRYGGYGGIAYHHVSDKYIALFTHFITCGVWEAVYILDGLLKNVSDIQPDTVCGDTQSQSAPVFALSYLLGIKLMPRIRNWKDLSFLRPTEDARYEYIEPLFKGTVNWNLIKTHWFDMMRVVLSIKAGKVMPSTLLRKLSSYSKKNRLYQAFCELGKVIRTMFLLEYISNMKMRQEINAVTNIVEKYHHFLDWIFFGKEGAITDNDPIEQEKRLKYLDLVASSLILQNTVDISLAIQTMIAQGEVINHRALEALSPYPTRHIKRYGDFIINLNNIPQPLETALNLPPEIFKS